MVQEHWFDVMNKATLQALTRREITRSIAVLLPSLLFSGVAETAAGKNKGGKKKGSKGKGSKKGNRKKGNRKTGNGTKTPDHLDPPEPGEDYCASYLATVPELLDDCREILEQCYVPDQFCIYDSQPELNENTYGVACCPSPKECCGTGCVDTRRDNNNCGDCGEACGAGEVCIDGDCVCEGPECVCLDRNCPPGQLCHTSRGHLCNGQSILDCICGCGPGKKYCQHSQVGSVCVSENSTIC